jgi:hypothetical protein
VEPVAAGSPGRTDSSRGKPAAGFQDDDTPASRDHRRAVRFADVYTLGIMGQDAQIRDMAVGRVAVSVAP